MSTMVVIFTWLKRIVVGFLLLLILCVPAPPCPEPESLGLTQAWGMQVGLDYRVPRRSRAAIVSAMMPMPNKRTVVMTITNKRIMVTSN